MVEMMTASFMFIGLLVLNGLICNFIVVPQRGRER